ncbi:Hypothetical predicted protein, partial [Pelobates cultripes]
VTNMDMDCTVLEGEVEHAGICSRNRNPEVMYWQFRADPEVTSQCQTGSDVTTLKSEVKPGVRKRRKKRRI